MGGRERQAGHRRVHPVTEQRRHLNLPVEGISREEAGGCLGDGSKP
ncbi:hypothetical protein Misp01_33370 [Microtetraspora sp. NBRC 13810]|nr:hypothetical protein Misp01_33370 [Microtetraspora sp. NBRC 13810]